MLQCNQNYKETALLILRGFFSQVRITEQEKKVLIPLAVVRVALDLIIGYYSACKLPDNKEYLLKT